MSTRHARIADKELNEKHTRILVELLQRPENKTCADCRKRDPRWASWNLGIFVCIRCSGTHRSLGTHISKVKSVDLDTWIPEQVENMIKWGNQRANLYWEATLNGQQPMENSMEVWIRAKYEQKRWVKQEGAPAGIEKKQEIASIQEADIVKPSISSSTNIEQSSVMNQSSSEVNSESPKYSLPPVIQKLSEPKVKREASNNVKSTTQERKSVPPPSKTTVTSSGFKIDMSSFQEQLSGLSLGRPSSGLIPQAPPGSDTSWTNFLIKKTSDHAVEDLGGSSTLSQTSTEKPVIPYE